MREIDPILWTVLLEHSWALECTLYIIHTDTHNRPDNEDQEGLLADEHTSGTIVWRVRSRIEHVNEVPFVYTLV